MIELETFRRLFDLMPVMERKIPLVKVGWRHLSAEEALALWEKKGVSEAVASLFDSALQEVSLLSLGDDFIASRIQTKFRLGMVAPFYTISGNRVSPEELMEHLSKRDEVGMMRIRAERKFLAELIKRSARGVG